MEGAFLVQEGDDGHGDIFDRFRNGGFQRNL